MIKFIDELISQDLSFDEIIHEFNLFARSNDSDVYSNFTFEDLNVRDEFESYLNNSSNIDDLRKNGLVDDFKIFLSSAQSKEQNINRESRANEVRSS